MSFLGGKQATMYVVDQSFPFCFGSCVLWLFMLQSTSWQKKNIKNKRKFIQLVLLKMKLLMFLHPLLRLFVSLAAGSVWNNACNHQECPVLSFLSFDALYFLSFSFSLFYLMVSVSFSASIRSANLCPRTAQAFVFVVTPPCRVNR